MTGQGPGRGRPVRVGLFAASPVYYQAPLYRRLAADPRVDFTAVFGSARGVRGADPGYGWPVAFDADALSGYRSIFLPQADAVRTTGSFFALRDPALVREIARSGYEVLWLHGYYSCAHLLAAATQLIRRRALMFREEQTLLERRPLLKHVLKEALLRVLFARSIGLTIGSANKRWFLRFGMGEERLFYAPYCVDNEALRAEAERLRPQRESLRREFGISRDSGPVIVSVARLVPKKQPLFLLEAFRQVRATRRCTLLYVGSGELEAEMREAIRRWRVPDVVFAGFLNQSQISKAYAVADVFALPSLHDETWGLAVNEAMNFGLPVVVSDKVGCAADLVREGDNGFIVPADNPQPLAERLALLTDSPELRRRFGVAARERIRGWTYNVAADGLLRAIEHAVGPERWAAADAWRRRTDFEVAAKASR